MPHGAEKAAFRESPKPLHVNFQGGIIHHFLCAPTIRVPAICMADKNQQLVPVRLLKFDVFFIAHLGVLETVNDVKIGAGVNFGLEGKLETFHAKVYARESRMDQNTHTLTLRALYPNANGNVMPGRYADIRLSKNEIHDALAVPSEAIVPEMGKDKIFLYKSGKAQPVEIQTGIRTEAETQVLQGLQTGDTIIISGTLQLRTGLPVTLDNIY